MGYAMEIEDCAFELISEIKISTNPKDAFLNCDVALLIGGHPHLKGMERKDLLEKNHEIFKEIGFNLNEYASPNCKIVVIANPVNSLLTILAHYADKLPKKNFTALSRLDLNRAKSLTAKLCKTSIKQVTDLIVWGNHSDSQYPDVTFSKINGKNITEYIDKSKDWLHTEFVHLISNRWKKIVEATGTTRYFFIFFFKFFNKILVSWELLRLLRIILWIGFLGLVLILLLWLLLVMGIAMGFLRGSDFLSPVSRKILIIKLLIILN